MQNVKHVGRLISNNRKVLVVYRTLPGEADKCIVVGTENLPDTHHDALINLVESSTGQDANELWEVLARSVFPDGAIMLNALHVSGKLAKVSTDQVEMIPNPSSSILLSELNQIIAAQQGVSVGDLSIKSEIPTETKPESKKEPVMEDRKTPSTAPASDTVSIKKDDYESLKAQVASLVEENKKIIHALSQVVDIAVETAVTTIAPIQESASVESTTDAVSVAKSPVKSTKPTRSRKTKTVE